MVAKTEPSAPYIDEHGCLVIPLLLGTRIFITSLKIKVHVSGMSSLKIYNPLGEVDASVHFPLFGLEAQKGSCSHSVIMR